MPGPSPAKPVSSMSQLDIERKNLEDQKVIREKRESESDKLPRQHRSVEEKWQSPLSKWHPFKLLHDLAPLLATCAAFLLTLLVIRADISRALLTASVVGVGFFIWTTVRANLRPEDNSPAAAAVRRQSSMMKLNPEHFVNQAADASPDEDSPRTSAEKRKGVKHSVLLSTPNRVFASIRALDLTPLIKVHFDESTPWPLVLADHHKPDISHLKGSRKFVVEHILGPRLMLRMARYAAGCDHWRVLGKLTGKQILHLLLPGERYNFVVASRPMRIVISHVGPGSAGGLYAKHALLAELADVSFAGELWIGVNRKSIHVNNSSGTYQPTDEELQHVEKFLESALQLEVHAHVRPDKDLTQQATEVDSDADEDALPPSTAIKPPPEKWHTVPTS